MRDNLLSSVSSVCVREPWRPPMPPGLHVCSTKGVTTVTCYIKGDKRPRTIHLDGNGRGIIPLPDYDAGQTMRTT